MVNLFRVKRLSLGLTMTQLAERAGVSKQFISQCEKGEAWPGPALIPRLAGIFKMEPERFARELEKARQESVTV